MVNFIDKTSQNAGTPLNRSNMMAIQGMEAETIEFGNNTVTETFDKGGVKTTQFNATGSIREEYSSEGKSIVKITKFDRNTITVTISGS